MGRLAAKKRKKIYGYLKDEKPRSSTNTDFFGPPIDGRLNLVAPSVCLNDFPRPVERPLRVRVIPYPGLSSLFKEKPKPRSSLPSTNMEQPRSSLLATNMEKPSKMRAFIKYKKLLRIRQTWADKQYKKSHQGNGWKKPFAGSLHIKDFIVHDEMCIQ